MSEAPVPSNPLVRLPKMTDELLLSFDGSDVLLIDGDGQWTQEAVDFAAEVVAPSVRAEIERLRAALKDTLIWLKAAHVCKDWVWDVEQWNAAEGVIEDARKLLNEAAPAVETCTCGNGSIPGPAHHPTCSAYFEPARPGETFAVTSSTETNTSTAPTAVSPGSAHDKQPPAAADLAAGREQSEVASDG